MQGGLKQLLAHEIRDLASAEDQIIGALPTMIEKANDSELKQALQHHLKETETHKQRLQQVAKTLDIQLDGSRCKGMAGILAEGKEAVEEQSDHDVRDAAIIASAQRVEHYEMAGYGTAAQFARRLGNDEVAKRLTETLGEEKHADATLTGIAEGHVNRQARSH